MTSSAARKMRRIEKKGPVVSPVQALQGLSQIGDLAGKIDQFVAAAQQMEALAGEFEGIDVVMETVKSAKDAVAEVQERLTGIETQQEAQKKALLRVIYYFKQFFTEGSLIPSELDELEAQLNPPKADEPG